MSFQSIYVAQMRELRDSLGKNIELDRAVENASFSRPAKVPEQVWDNLSPSQRARSFLQRWANRVADQGTTSGMLSESDFLRLTSPDLSISAKAQEVIQGLLEGSLQNNRNPTLLSVVRQCVTSVQSGEPVRLWVSQCIGKEASVREGKLDYFLGRSDGRPLELEKFTTCVEEKGWARLRNYLDTIRYPLEITLFIGDMDFFTLDGCDLWCSGSSLLRLEGEFQARCEELQVKADQYFGPGVISVRRWSELYDRNQYEEQLRLSSDKSRWQDADVLLSESRAMYLDQWRYREISGRLNVDPNKVVEFIDGDVTRTAAQYRLETDLALASGVIQCWAEAVPAATWPIRISQYDGRPSAGQLLLVGAALPKPAQCSSLGTRVAS
ncbi:MAG: hypothetical protein KDD64_02090 [Bdellovibrionales bacterium]|nr:hypothetical protein [Bdellovibrionales bacterium]